MVLKGKAKETETNNSNTKSDTTSTKSNNSSSGDLVLDVGGIKLPQFFPSDMLNLSLVNSQEELEQVKAKLTAFRKSVALTKQSYKAQESAADLALELAKSKNQLIAHLAKTILKQAKNDAELASLLQALPQMFGAIQGTISGKAEIKARDFTNRIAAAGKPKQAA